jgi:hypothetical protein
MNKSTQNNFTEHKSIEQAVRVFSYFDLILNQLKDDAKASFSQSLSIFKKISESIKNETLSIAHPTEKATGDLFSNAFSLCKINLNEIAILLQFEDILTQKFDHISQINQIVIDELQNNTKPTTENKLTMLKKIILLTSAQLEYVKDEYEAVRKDLKIKLEEIYKASESVLSAIQRSEKENSRYSSFFASIHSSMKLIRSFIDTDIVKFSAKIDALIKTFEGLDIKTISSDEKLEEFDLHQLLQIYTIESERTVFKRALTGGDEKFSDETTASSSDLESIHLF